MRIAAALVAAAMLSACAGGRGGEKAHRASENDLSAIQAIHAPLGNRRSGAPLNAILVSGTITNTGSEPLRCTPSSFLLVDPRGNATAPFSQWCDVPSIAPKQSAIFNASFPSTAAADGMQLRFMHPDGSYEVHDLALPPA